MTTAAGLLAMLAVPMLWALSHAVVQGLNGGAWARLLEEPAFWPAWGLSLWTGISSTLIAAGISAWILSKVFPGPAWNALVRRVPVMLAVPHVAFAVGVVAWLAPSGWWLRLLSPWATSLTAPPPWTTTQDPWGLGLIATLVLKEVPFLLWMAATQLQRPDAAQRWQRELEAAQSMGYSRAQAWWRVLWPQLWPRLRWPLLAVLSYGMTVVDVALVIGPQSPPTLSVLAWTWLQDVDHSQSALGGSAAWWLALNVALCSLLQWMLWTRPIWRKRWINGARGRMTTSAEPRQTLWSAAFLTVAYAAVLLALALGSFFGVWAFPALWPQSWTLGAWNSVWHSAGTLWTTLWLAAASSAVALAWSVAWLESSPAGWDKALRQWMYLPLAMPGVLWVVGVHGLTLRWHIDTHGAGVWLAHVLATLPYVLIALSPAYQGFDPRHAQLTASLGRTRWAFLWHVKWPLLRASLASSLAVGFAVSVAQYLPTLYVGGGRFVTVTTEAVNLAAGAQRALTSAYAMLQWLLPVLGFTLAARLGRPRRFPSASHP